MLWGTASHQTVYSRGEISYMHCEGPILGTAFTCRVEILSRERCARVRRDGMSRADAEELVKTALALAMSRDGSSGGLARLVTITKAGAERRMIKGDEIPLFWDEIEPMGTNGAGMVVV